MAQNNEVKCKRCGYSGDISSYHPTISVYSDIRCPECGSTNNEHNSEYLRRLSEAMRTSKSETEDGTTFEGTKE